MFLRKRHLQALATSLDVVRELRTATANRHRSQFRHTDHPQNLRLSAPFPILKNHSRISCPARLQSVDQSDESAFPVCHLVDDARIPVRARWNRPSRTSLCKYAIPLSFARSNGLRFLF